MKRILLFGFFISSLLFSACSFSRGDLHAMMPGDFDLSMPMDTASSQEAVYGEETKLSFMADTEAAYTPESVDRKIIYTASLSLHVEEVREAGEAIQVLVEGMGGNVTDSNITRGSNSYTGWFTLRVPVDQFQLAMTELKALSVYVDSEYSNAQDVTEYYMDLETRLTNKQAEEAQYLEILTRAQTVTEILSVTAYLSDVRYEIESIQGQINYYDSQTDYSTITVYLSEDESVSAVSETWKPVSTFRGAISDWVIFLQGAADLVIYLVIFGWPFLILAWGIRAFFRRSKKPAKK